MNLIGGKRCDAYGEENGTEKCKWMINKLQTYNIRFNYATY